MREREEEVTTKCSFSFRCTHAARHAPHTCQKSCREGGADREGDEEGGFGGREGDRRGGGGECASIDGMIWRRETEKKWGF